jgi:hypothetical protein
MRVEIQINWSSRKARVVRHLNKVQPPFEYEYLDFDLEDECPSPEQAAQLVREMMLQAHMIGTDDEVVTSYKPE